uniref:DNA uptake protein n=1 Tax=Cyanothece sp. (strain PCC 7425 / ATCC 29141) TaxID=395961 RepID=B8HQX5_CYAP4
MIRFFRYFFMLIVVACLAISLHNCAENPSNTVSSPPPATSPANSPSGTASNEPRININTAILSELDKLEAKLGIPALSHQIQASRPYGSVEDLVSKKVLSQTQFDQIKDQVTVEEIALTGEAKDVDYLTKLGLMKGHMLIAGQLLELKLPKQAEPHLGHPVEEIYVDLAEQLPERNVPEFSDILTKTQDLVKSKPNDPQVQPTYNQAMAAIDQAIAALPAEELQSPSFVLKAVTEMLETAVAEYTAAISNGKITEVIEYQDSRGFVEYAKDTLLKQIEPKLEPAVASDLSTKMDNLFKAWPEPVPPTAPVASADQVATQVKAIEQAAAPAIS